MHPPISRRKSQIQESAPVMKFQLQQMGRLERMEVRKGNVCELDVWRVSRLSFRRKNKIMLELCRCNLKTNHHNQISSDEVKKESDFVNYSLEISFSFPLNSLKPSTFHEITLAQLIIDWNETKGGNMHRNNFNFYWTF